MTVISLLVKVDIGEGISAAARDAFQLARDVDCRVSFDFNGVTCVIGPDGKPDDLVIAYNRALNSGPFRCPAVSI